MVTKKRKWEKGKGGLKSEVIEKLWNNTLIVGNTDSLNTELVGITKTILLLSIANE